MTFQQAGTDFLPANPTELIATHIGILTLASCHFRCSMNPLCRTFVSDITWPSTCYLYEGLIDTGTIIMSSSPTSQVGGLRYDTSLNSPYNKICFSNAPSTSRYLVCTNEELRCPRATYWKQAMCLNQVHFHDACNINENCRQDVGLQCSSSCNRCVCNSTTIWNGTSCVQLTCPSVLPGDQTLTSLWSFDNDASDLMNIYNGTLIGNPSFVTGYINQAIQIFNSSYVLLPHINFYQRSFTVELWFYLTNSTNIAMALFSECASASVAQCLQFGINANNILHMDFWLDDVSGTTILAVGVWYHVAFVYDYNRRQRFIYLNGLMENTNVLNPAASHLYLGQSGNAAIGSVPVLHSYFIGYIDHISITHRAKSAAEILNDATLVAYYSFDCGSTLDSGPNLLHGIAVEQTTVVGRANNALQFNSLNGYFQAFGFTALGSSKQPYSISLWVKPLSLAGTLVHLSTHADGTGSCLSVLGFLATGALITMGPNTQIVGPMITVNTWTHIVQTFSSTNGFHLYINATMYASPAVNISNIPAYAVYLTLANRLLGPASCHQSYIPTKAYSGAIDEVRIYNREINASEVCMLFS